jgi:hypothetical protein
MSQFKFKPFQTGKSELTAALLSPEASNSGASTVTPPPEALKALNVLSDQLKAEAASNFQEAIQPMKNPITKKPFSDILASELAGVENEEGFAPGHEQLKTPPVTPIPPKQPEAGFVKPIDYSTWTCDQIIGTFKKDKLCATASKLGMADLTKVSKDPEAMKILLASLDDDTFWKSLYPKHVDLVAARAGLVPPKTFKAAAPIGQLRHRQFDEVVRWLTSRTGGNLYQPVWLWGGPGSGKSTLAEQLAEVLYEFAKMDVTERGLEAALPPPEDFFHPLTCANTMTKSDLVGFKGAASGAYVEGIARQPFEKGGLLFLDECDNSNTAFLVSFNAVAAQQLYRFPDGKIVKRHPYFFILAGANTLGTGSTNGFQRQAQDAASRDRFAKVYFDYDRALEKKIANHDRWVDYVHKVRDYVATIAKCCVHITSRCCYGGAAALKNGVPAAQVCESFIFCEFTKDVQASIKAKCGVFQG